MNRKKRTISFIIIQIFILFISLENVMAAPTSVEKFNLDSGMANTVKDKVKKNRKNIVVCAYSCSKFNSGYTEGRCGETGEVWNTIIYQAEGNEENDWRIDAGTVLRTVEDFSTIINEYTETYETPSIYLHEWKSIGPALPQVYYGATTNGDKNQDWQIQTQSYKNLNESFICPQYSFYDESVTFNYCSTTRACKEQHYDNRMELCLADDTTSCSTRNESNYTSFNIPNELSFSFAEQLNSVLDRMKETISNMSDEEVLRPYGLPESEANSEEFFENICELLNQSQVDYQFSEGTNHEEELNRLIIDSYTAIEKERNVIISNNTAISPSYYNKEIYNFTDLSNILVNGKGKEFKNVIFNNQSMSDKFNDTINNVYINRVKSATASYQKQCEEKHGRKYDLDIDKLGEDIKVSIDKIVTKYNIDLGDLNCDNIFAEFADTIKTAYFFLEIAAIIIAIALTALDYSKVILSDNQDEMKKTNKKLFKRLILVMVLFLLPAIINMTLRVFKIEGFDSKEPLCINVTEK